MTETNQDQQVGRIFEGQITVSSRIIDSLSSGLYKSPAACLKELINNSYDADATIVRVWVKPDADRIIIDDDGIGMTRETFVRHFSRISESHKRDDDEKTDSGRPKIGKIGIGFIAANELCEEMEIYSTCGGSPELLHVTINFDKMRLDPAVRRQGNSSDFEKGDYHGEVLEANPEEHYTRVFLKRVRGDAKDILAGAISKARDTSLYGLKPESITQKLLETGSWSSFDDYSKTMLGVALNVPVPYADEWIAPEFRQQLSTFEDTVDGLNFTVEYDGTELRKPVVLAESSPDAILRLVEFVGEHVSAKGWIYAQHGTLRPEDLNGVLVRIRNAAVGEYSKDFLDFPHAEGTLFQRWITAEIYADDRLEDALNIDRRTLRDTHPAYVELRKWFHGQLSSFLGEVRRELYAKPSAERKRQREAEEVTNIQSVAEEAGRTYGVKVRRQIELAWTTAPATRPAPAKAQVKAEPAKPKRQSATVNRKYSVSEMYKIVLAVASETLSAEDAEKFIAELTKRLRG